MKAKHITLLMGVPLVALGTRLLCDNQLDTSTFLISVGIFFLGQLVVRFQDYPPVQTFVEQWDKRLPEKKIDYSGYKLNNVP